MNNLLAAVVAAVITSGGFVAALYNIIKHTGAAANWAKRLLLADVTKQMEELQSLAEANENAILENAHAIAENKRQSENNSQHLYLLSLLSQKLSDTQELEIAAEILAAKDGRYSAQLKVLADQIVADYKANLPREDADATTEQTL